MALSRIAAFSDGSQGGNPAGVWIGDELPIAANMQRMAAEVGFSETAFAAPQQDGFRVRYFAPETEVPFCGHATIALGAALAQQFGDQTFALQLNSTRITVSGQRDGSLFRASLQSPATHSRVADDNSTAEFLHLFGYQHDDLHADLPPAFMHAGADHFLLVLRSRETLRAMHYDLNMGKKLMQQHGLITVMLAYAEANQIFVSRNAFAAGGVYEDPATGAATAAFAGYLRDRQWPHQGRIELIQGEDMGMRSRLLAEFDEHIGGSIRVSGTARIMA